MFGTLAFSTAFVIRRLSARFIASGFSQRIILPALAAARAISAWTLLGAANVDKVDIRTGDELFPVGLDGLIAPDAGESPRFRGIAAAGGLEHGLMLAGEEIADPAEGIRVGAAHEAVADHADIERFHCKKVRGFYSVQPWLLRTSIMAVRTSFQVFCCNMTALGNMQPSQQMCLICFMTRLWPSRSQ